jgi:TRAP-type mannitol/chloroaromatic compound transport system permease large subunit
MIEKLLMALGGLLALVGIGLMVTVLVMWAFWGTTIGANPEGVMFLGLVSTVIGAGLIGMGAEL